MVLTRELRHTAFPICDPGAQYVYMTYACSSYTLGSSDCTSITQQWNDIKSYAWGGSFAGNATCAASGGQITLTFPVVYAATATFLHDLFDPVCDMCPTSG
jgi:hypothetical protein